MREELGQYLRRVREAQGLSLDRLSARLAERGVSLSPSTLWRIEQGISGLAVDAAAVLGACLGVSLGCLESKLRAAHRLRAPALGEVDPEFLRDEARSLVAAGRLSEALEAFEDLEERLGGDACEDRLALADCLLAQADVHRRLHHHVAAAELAGRALELDAGDEMRLRALLMLVTIHVQRGEPKRAEIYANTARAALDGASPAVRAYAFAVLGGAASRFERFDEAVSCYEEALSLYRELDRPADLARVKIALGYALHRTGHPREGRRIALEGFRAARDAEQQEVALFGLIKLGRIAHEQRDGSAARMALENAVALAHRLGLVHEEFRAWYLLWSQARAAGDTIGERRAERALKHLATKVHADLPEVESFRRAQVDDGERDRASEGPA